jgi:hypothetical protein
MSAAQAGEIPIIEWTDPDTNRVAEDFALLAVLKGPMAFGGSRKNLVSVDEVGRYHEGVSRFLAGMARGTSKRGARPFPEWA